MLLDLQLRFFRNINISRTEETKLTYLFINFPLREIYMRHNMRQMVQNLRPAVKPNNQEISKISIVDPVNDSAI